MRLRSTAYAIACRTRLSFQWSSRRLKPIVCDTGFGIRCTNSCGLASSRSSASGALMMFDGADVKSTSPRSSAICAASAWRTMRKLTRSSLGRPR